MQRGTKDEELAGDGGEIKRAVKASQLEAGNAAIWHRKVCRVLQESEAA